MSDVMTAEPRVTRGRLKKPVYSTGDIAAILSLDIPCTGLSVVNYIKAGHIEATRMAGSETRKGPRVVKHEWLLAFLRKEPRTWTNALEAIGEDPGPPPAAGRRRRD